MRRPLLVLIAGLVCGVAAAAPAAGVLEQSPKRGGTVVVAVGGSLRCLNPLDEACGLPLFMGKVLEPAFVPWPDSTLRPQLVTGATTYTKTPFTVTFRIHPDARWSDGVPVTAGDFVFSHNAIVGHLPPEMQGPHRLVRSARAVGAKTVKVVLRRPTADWRELFYRVLPRHALRGQDLAGIWRNGIENPRTGAPIGNGPFLLQSWDRGEQMTFVRNPRYWGSHTAYLDRIVMRNCRSCGLLPPADVLAAIKQGDVDMAGTRDPVFISELRGIPGVKVIPGRILGLDHLALRRGLGGHPALKNKLVRRALAYGIDRKAIARTVFAELDPSYPASDSAVFFNSSPHYRPNWEIYRHRPALARRLLEQAGCRLGADGIYVCAGQRLSLQVIGLAGATFRVRTLDMVQRQLRQVGVAIELSYAPAATLFGPIFDSGAFDAVEFLYGSFYGLGSNIYGCGREGNITGYCQRLVTADLNQADRILDDEQRARVMNRADRRLAKDVPVIPLYQTPNFVAFRATIRNVVSATGHELWNAENWWLGE